MKIKALFLCLIISLIFSCKPNDNLDLPISHNSVYSANRGARTITTANDPNLNPNWNWTNSTWSVYFNNLNGTIGTINTLNPFVDGSQKVFGSTNPSNADMYSSQGWMLVSRDFGTPTDAPVYPFIMLYNKQRGLLRVCLLKTYDYLTSFQEITLNYANATVYPTLFKFASNSPDLIGGNANNTFTQSAITYGGNKQWLIAEFNLQGYSVNIDNYASLNINLYDVASSQYSSTGSIFLDGSAEPLSSDGSIWSGSQSIIAAVTPGTNLYNSIKELKPTFSSVSTTFSSVSAAFDAVKSVVSAFTGGSSGTTYNIKLQGTTSESGTITLTSPKTSFSVYLKPISSVNYHALQTIPWGVLNLSPLSVTKTYSDLRSGNYMDWTIPAGFLTNTLKINPALTSDISQINVGLNGVLQPLQQYNATAHYGTIYNTGNNNNVSIGTFGIEIIYNNGNIVYQGVKL